MFSDNWAQNIYISDASYVICRRNLIYNTPNNAVGKQASTSLADEVASKPRSTNNTIINNLFYNTNFSAFGWTIVSGSGLTNALIANNTFVGSQIQTGSINSGNRIFDNIFTINGNVPSASGITWKNNLWQTTRPANAVGTGDVFGDPLLAKTGTISPGALTANYFKISSASSSAINKATVLTEVTEDYFKASRGSSPDIGAHEYAAIAPTSSLCSSVQAPVIDGIAESTWTSIKSDTLKNIITGTVASPSDLSATHQAMWDNTALYLLVKVKDDVLKNDSPNPWDDDALEIFIDGNNDKATTYDANDHQYILRWNDLTVYEYHNGVATQNPAGITFSQGANTGGYLMEIKIAWSAIGVTPAAAKLIGFDMLVDDDDDGGAADASKSWFTQTTSLSYDPSAFGTITLSGTFCNGTTTGIVNEGTDNEIVIYPNPVNSNLKIQINLAQEKNVEIKIYDGVGREVFGQKVNTIQNGIKRQADENIDTSTLQNGIYFLSVQVENNIKVKKLIVQH